MGTVMYPPYGWLPSLWGKISYGLIYALILVFVMYFIMYKTQWGFELNMIGKNPFAAQCQGVSLKKNMIIVMLNLRRHRRFCRRSAVGGRDAPADKRNRQRIWVHRHHHAWMGGLKSVRFHSRLPVDGGVEDGKRRVEIMNLSASNRRRAAGLDPPAASRRLDLH
jgi:hypothetical protein